MSARGLFPPTGTPASRMAAKHVDQGHFDFLMPYSERRTLLSPQEVAKVLNRSVDFVEQMIEEGRLEAFGPRDREKTRKQITRRSVLLLLAEQAMAEPELWFERVVRLVDACTHAQLDALIIRATQRRARL